jgi:hypothetical protein
MRLPVFLLALSLAACASAGGGSSGAPSTFVQSNAEARTTRVIEVREGLSKAIAMRTLVDAFAPRYTVEVTDPRVGFVMTAWDASLVRSGIPDLRYRTRFVARFVGDEWKTLQLRHEANWAHGDDWDTGYDAAQLDSVTNELRQKLGRKP